MLPFGGSVVRTTDAAGRFAADSKAGLGSAEGVNKVLLVVDDEALIRDWLEGELSEAGFEELVPEMGIVYMTSDSGLAWPFRGVPGSVILSKPFALAQLVTAISALLTEADARQTISGTSMRDHRRWPREQGLG